MPGKAQARHYWLMVLPLLILVVGLYGVPVLNILRLSVATPTPGLANYVDALSDPGVLAILWTTVRVCLLVTALSLAIGYVIAYAMVHVSERERDWMLIAVLVSFWLSVLIRAFAWLTILGRRGVLNTGLLQFGLIDEPLSLVRNEIGVLVGMVHYMVPYAVLPLLANMSGIDRRITDASRSLGAGAWTTFWRVYLPMTVPGLLAAGLLVLIISLGFYVTPAILGGGKVLMVAEFVSVQVLVTTQWGLASVLATLLLIGVFGVVFVLSRFVNLAEAFGAKS